MVIASNSQDTHNRPRILLVDDDETLARHLAETLSDEYVVDVAADGEEALKAVLRGRPELIVTDLVMPRLDGVELVKYLRNTPSTAAIPILMISGRAPEEVRIEGFVLGADSYLPKPYTERELRARIAAMLQSARRQFEVAQREAQEQLARRTVEERAQILESITDAFFAVDRSWRFTYVNQKALDHYRKNLDELIDQVLWDVFPPARDSVFEREFERAMREQTSVTFEAISAYTGGWLEVHAYPSASGLAVNLRDITDRKRAEAALRDSELRFRSMADALPVLIWRADPENRGTWFNGPWLEFTGRTLEQELGAGWAEVLHPADRERAVRMCQRALERREPLEMEIRLRRHDGEYRWMLDRGMPVFDGPDGAFTGYIGTCVDITDRKLTEEKLRENERQLAAEVDSMTRLHELVNELLVCTDLQTALEEVLDTTISLTGADKGNVQLLDPKTGCLEIVAQRGFDAAFLSHFRSVQCNDGSACGKALADGHRVVIEDVQRDASFERHRRIAAMADFRAVQSTPLTSRSGEVLGMLSTHFREPHALPEREQRMIDLYARQAADFIERVRVEEALREGERRKDEFLATLAHELRNPLAPIRNGLQILKLRGPSEPTLERVSSMMERQMSHLVRLVDDLLDVSRISRGKLELRRERLLLTEVLSSSVEASTHVIEMNEHVLEVDVRAEDLVINGDLNRLAQVFSNLLSNSAKYTDRGGKISLTVEREHNSAIVKVRDNGIGIPPEAVDRVFEMFSQLHTHERRTDSGLGIGLALVRKLVEMHEGTVTAFSEGAGKGSTFIVRLPLAEGHVNAEGQAVALGRAHPNGPARRRVLIADDNVDAAASLALMLELEGNDVRVVHDGEQAVQSTAGFAPDVIFMDIGMPRMNGLEATRRIRAMPRGENIIIAALSGWGQEIDRQRSKLAGVDYHLVKPVATDDLRSVLEDSVSKHVPRIHIVRS